MSTRDLIDAITAGDSAAIQTEFEQAMATRIADRIDVMRQEVAKSMFNEQSVDEVVDLDEEEGINEEEEDPTGIKIYHQDKTGKSSHTTVFTTNDARARENEVKKAGGKVTHRALVYGTREGQKVPVK